MKRVAEALTVSRSRLAERVKEPATPASLLQGRGRGAFAPDSRHHRPPADLLPKN